MAEKEAVEVLPWLMTVSWEARSESWRRAERGSQDATRGPRHQGVIHCVKGLGNIQEEHGGAGGGDVGGRDEGGVQSRHCLAEAELAVVEIGLEGGLEDESLVEPAEDGQDGDGPEVLGVGGAPLGFGHRDHPSRQLAGVVTLRVTMFFFFFFLVSLTFIKHPCGLRRCCAVF